ncbi:MAG: nitroreductase family protein [Candidatus Hydrogenedentota bacterium]|nr:MAG: nitroreductase family protein [Candidatus Hydrogenedentota bacterium]
MDTIEAIRTRRSIRQYKDTPVTDEQLKTVLEAVQWAPSWANSQCWEIVVVEDPATKEKLAGTLSPGNPSSDAVKKAPVVIVACARKGKAGYYKGQAITSKGDWLLYDMGLAMQNLCLAAHSIGLGTVHMGAFVPEDVEKIVGVPEDVTVVAMTPLGVPAADSRAPKRREIEEFVHHEKF